LFSAHFCRQGFISLDKPTMLLLYDVWQALEAFPHRLVLRRSNDQFANPQNDGLGRDAKQQDGRRIATACEASQGLFDVSDRNGIDAVLSGPANFREVARDLACSALAAGWNTPTRGRAAGYGPRRRFARPNRRGCKYGKARVGAVWQRVMRSPTSSSCSSWSAVSRSQPSIR
jgi:hypothetical protein